MYTLSASSVYAGMVSCEVMSLSEVTRVYTILVSLYTTQVYVTCVHPEVQVLSSAVANDEHPGDNEEIAWESVHVSCTFMCMYIVRATL